MKQTALVLVLSLAVACATQRAAILTPPSLGGITLGQRADDVASRMEAAGASRGPSDRSGQEAWNVRTGPYRAVMVGYDAGQRVRFITAITDPAAPPLRYADVIDLAHAQQRTTGSRHLYVQTVKRFPESRTYRIEARGSTDDRVDYLTVRRLAGESEEDEEKEKEK